MLRIFTFFLFMFFLTSAVLINAEGTRELAPNADITVNGVRTTDVAALLLNHQAYGDFGRIDGTNEHSRLYVNIQDPSAECIYIGFSRGHINLTSPNPPTEEFSFVIKDPNGNVVYGPHLITAQTANIQHWSEAFTGPAPLYGNDGYIPIEVNSSELQAGGWSGTGDYYIEFDNGPFISNFLIDFWDITVINCENTEPEEKKGRVWSYNWALFAINDYGFPERPFNGSFYVCAPDETTTDKWFISQIDFNNSGFKPAAFNIAFNRFGTQNTGDIAYDRQSVENANLTFPEYPIFLNDPVEIYATAETGQLVFNALERDADTDLCFKVVPSSTGQIDLLIDLDGNDGVYTEDTRDVLLSFEVSDTMVGREICIPWDGRDGLNRQVHEGSVPLLFSFNQGIYHFPIYDAEFMEKGFTIHRVRPEGNPPLLYYDDSQITLSPGTGEPKVNLAGCTLPCHSWTTYIHPDLPGYGNLNTINSWWFSSSFTVDTLVTLPNALQCNLAWTFDLCSGGLGAIYLVLDSLGEDDFTLLNYIWEGPSVRESEPDYCLVDMFGTYSYSMTYVNNIGDTLNTECSIEISIDNNFGSCPSDSTIQGLSCLDELPEPFENIEDFLEEGYELGDTTCLNMEFILEETENGGTGCPGNPLVIQREYTIFHDANQNGRFDPEEISFSCTHLYEVVDSSLLAIEFNNPFLEGKVSGDTLYFQCEAGVRDWNLPELGEEDLAFANACQQPDIDFSYTKVADGSCAEDGYLARYKYQWDIVTACDSTTFEIYVEIFDTIAPVFLSSPRDTSVYCIDLEDISVPSFSEECCCASLEYMDETIGCENGMLQLIRTWTVSDVCGNSTSMEEHITVLDSSPLELKFIDGEVSDGDRLQVECTQGSFPREIQKWDENSVEVSHGCAEVGVKFKKKPLVLGRCADGVKEQWEFSWTATDACGNSAHMVVYVDIMDTSPPEFIDLPENTCKGFPSPDDYRVIDNCGKPQVKVSVVEVDNPACPDLEQREYTYVAMDACGNTSRVSRIYTRGQVNPPIIRPYNFNPGADNTVVIDCNSDWDYRELYTEEAVRATSSCSEIKAVYFNILSSEEGTCIDGIYKVDELRWIAVDECGNKGTLDLTVQYRDLEAPRLADFQEEVHVQCLGDLPQYRKIMDCNSASIVLDELDFVDDCISDQIARRTIVVEDICGNSRTYVQRVYIDRSRSIEILNDKPVICASDLDRTPLFYDNCYNSFLEANLVEVTEPQGCKEYIQEIRNWEMRTGCGTLIHYSQKVLKEAIPEPEITIEHPEYGLLDDNSTLQINCTEDGFGAEIFHFDDPCGIYKSALEIVPLQEECKNGVLQVEKYTYSLTDACGHVYTASLTLEYIDNTPPEFSYEPEDMTVNCMDETPIPEVEAFDLCSEVELELVELPVTQTGKPGVTRIWIAKDACGNMNTMEQVIVIEDRMNCHIEVPDNINCWSSTEVEVFVNGGSDPYTYKWETVSGQCLIQYTSDDPRAVITVLSDSVEIKVIIIDENGCSVECSVTIHCEDGRTNSFRSDVDKFSGSIEEENDVFLFPNPSEDKLFLKSQEVMEAVTIFGMDGRELRQYTPDDLEYELKHNLSSGMYLLKIQQAGKIVVKKFLVQ